MSNLSDRLRRLFGLGGAKETAPLDVAPDDICGTGAMDHRNDEASHAHHAKHPSPPGRDATPFQAQMDKDMARMMQDMHAPGYSGDVNVDFLAMMIPHHQGAIDMAKLQLVHGDDPLTRRLAEEIIDSQQVEIQAMLSRLRILQDGPDDSLLEYPALDGTRKF